MNSSSTHAWITGKDFEIIARISAQKSRRALSRAHSGRTWRGHHLIVRSVRGRGGKSGLHYEVRLDSLPVELRNLYSELQSGAPSRAAPDGRIDQADWRLEVIRPALGHPSGSGARAATLTALAARVHQHPNGKRRRVSLATLRTWIRRYEADGIAGLRPSVRRDRGERRVLVSRHWDSAVPFDDAIKERIADSLARYTRSLWANGAPSWQRVRQFATVRLLELTHEAGFEPAPEAMRRPFAVPRQFVERERPHGILAVRDGDAKAFFDDHTPRIRRAREGVEPMEIVVADVHHMDVLVHRADDSLATPKLISWHDVGTNRIFMTPVVLPKGKGVRQEHVVASFIAMTQHPEWGMPSHLYIDNGTEYGWSAFVDDAMKLAERVRNGRFEIRDLRAEPNVAALADRARNSMVVRARPYNAPSKIIEGAFSNLEGGVFSMIPGWIGGNRMAKKTHNVGRAPKPFSGTASDFQRALDDAIGLHNETPQSGWLSERSPNQAFAEAVTGGWQRIDIERAALESVFAREVPRTVRQGVITVNGTPFYHDSFLTLSGRRVAVRLPVVGGKDRLSVILPDGEAVIAERETRYGFLDPEGAREQRRRQNVQNAQLADLRDDVDRLDLLTEMRSAAKALGTPIPTPPSAGTIRLDERTEKVAEAQRAVPNREKSKLPLAEQHAFYREMYARHRART